MRTRHEQRDADNRFDGADDDRRLDAVIARQKYLNALRDEMEGNLSRIQEELERRGWIELKYLFNDCCDARGEWKTIGAVHALLFGGDYNGKPFAAFDCSFDEFAGGLQLFKDEPETFRRLKDAVLQTRFMLQNPELSSKDDLWKTNTLRLR
jgi:hypothetical protein